MPEESYFITEVPVVDKLTFKQVNIVSMTMNREQEVTSVEFKSGIDIHGTTYINENYHHIYDEDDIKFNISRVFYCSRQHIDLYKIDDLVKLEAEAYINKINKMIEEGKTFDEICDIIEE
jgi:hypothetical protein